MLFEVLGNETSRCRGDLVIERVNDCLSFVRQIASLNGAIVGVESFFSFARSYVKESRIDQLFECAYHIEIVHRPCRESRILEIGSAYSRCLLDNIEQ